MDDLASQRILQHSWILTEYIFHQSAGLHIHNTLLDDELDLWVAVLGVVLVIECLEGGDVPAVVFRDLNLGSF